MMEPQQIVQQGKLKLRKEKKKTPRVLAQLQQQLSVCVRSVFWMSGALSRVSVVEAKER